MTANGYEVDENVLNLDHGDHCPPYVNILKPMNCTLKMTEFYGM